MPILIKQVHSNYESMVSLVSGRYTRAEIRNENLVVCLSEYLPIYVIIGLKCRLGVFCVK